MQAAIRFLRSNSGSKLRHFPVELRSMIEIRRSWRKWAVLLILTGACSRPASAQKQMNIQPVNTSCSDVSSEIVAVGVAREIALDAQHPNPAWEKAAPVTFCADWQGKNADAERQTSVKALWSTSTLYLRFECRYRGIYVIDDSEPSGRRYQLWDRDVAEAFLQPDPSQLHSYKEFEVAPNGMWVDLDIVARKDTDLKSGLQRSVWRDEGHKTWVAELAIPIKSLTAKFDPAAVWRLNFFRVEGPEPERFYSAWQATKTPEANFHVPEVFGRLRFQPAKTL